MKPMKKRTSPSFENESARIPVEEVILQKMKKKRQVSSEEENSSKDREDNPKDEYSKADAEDTKEESEHDPSGGGGGGGEGEVDYDIEKDRQEEPSKPHATHGYHLVKGKMGHGMEDYIVAKNRKINGHELGLYAIFDSHSGRKVAEYLQSHLFDNILSQPDFWSNPKKAIKRAYRTMDDEILEEVVGPRGGSTAVTAILINREKLIVANVGDSRAILCRKGREKQITVDHKPEKEKDLIESKGGHVTKIPGSVPRVDGQLAMSRAFGDGKLKKHITSEPDVRVEMIDENTESIILASDGLWKVMSNEETMECVRNMKDPQEASEELIKEALARRSPDDISCVVVMFR